MDSSFYSIEELRTLGFAEVSPTSKVSRAALLLEPEKISIGSFSRIDAFTMISGAGGFVKIGNYVHIAPHCSVVGGGGITFGDFSGLSHGVRVFSASDDYSGEYMTNPTIAEKWLGVHEAEIQIGNHVIIGSNSIILPGVSIGIGSAIGALSLVNKSLDAFGIYSGVPARLIKKRKSNILNLEKQMLLETLQAENGENKNQ